MILGLYEENGWYEDTMNELLAVVKYSLYIECVQAKIEKRSRKMFNIIKRIKWELNNIILMNERSNTKNSRNKNWIVKQIKETLNL